MFKGVSGVKKLYAKYGIIFYNYFDIKFLFLLWLGISVVKLFLMFYYGEIEPQATF